jgi:cytoskeletal protein CcmA (bactofilin family)
MFAKSDKSSEKGSANAPAQSTVPAETSRKSPVPGNTAKASTGMPSIISSDLKVIGNLESAGDIQIDGTVEGDIHSRNVTISEGAHIEGAIFAETANLSGSVKGQVKAPTVKIAKTAKVVGDIIHDSLSIEAGAFLEGNYRRIEAPSKPQAATQAAPQDATQATPQGATQATPPATDAKSTAKPAPPLAASGGKPVVR